MSKTQRTPAHVQEDPAQSLPMKVDVKIGSIRPEGNVRAYASVNLNDCFAIRNVKVVDSSKGLFIAMPSYKAGNGEYKDICFPVTKEFREQSITPLSMPTIRLSRRASGKEEHRLILKHRDRHPACVWDNPGKIYAYIYGDDDHE